MDCPNCETEMETETASGYQRNPLGARVHVAVSTDHCPECGTIVDDLGNVIDPDEQPKYPS